MIIKDHTFLEVTHLAPTWFPAFCSNNNRSTKCKLVLGTLPL